MKNPKIFLINLLCIVSTWCIGEELKQKINTLTKNIEMLHQTREETNMPKLLESKHSLIMEALAQEKKIDRNKKIELFAQDCIQNQSKNDAIPAKNTYLFRVMTYNVHKWLTPDSLQNNIASVFQIINILNPDVCILQEASASQRAQELFKQQGYTFALCEAPGFGRFGNMIAYKTTYQATTSLGIYQTPPVHGEGRCYLKAVLNTKALLGENLVIYGTHLDVFDSTGSIRKRQIQELLEQTLPDLKSPTILAADFNAVRKQDYNYTVNGKNAWSIVSEEYESVFKTPMPTQALELLQEQGYKDCFTKADIKGPLFTVWTGTVVDFLFLSKNWNLPINDCFAYYSAASDHLPIIMDIAVTQNK